MEVAAASTGGCFSLWELGISCSSNTRDQTASRGGRARTGSPGMSPLIPRAGRRGRISSRAIVQAMKGAITDERSNHRPRPPLRHPRGISAILEQLSGVCSSPRSQPSPASSLSLFPSSSNLRRFPSPSQRRFPRRGTGARIVSSVVATTFGTDLRCLSGVPGIDFASAASHSALGPDKITQTPRRAPERRLGLRREHH